jgi:transcription elongation factor GreA
LYKIYKNNNDRKNKLIDNLIGKNKDDLVEIITPAGVKNFEIKDVKYI